MTIQSKQDLPLTFRTEVVKSILECVGAGDSCSVIGIGSVGKSNLMRFLQQPDVRQAYLGETWNNYLFVYVDLNKLLKQSLWGLAELMLHQLMIEVSHLEAEESARQSLDELHQRATQPKTRFLAVRYLDRAIGLVCNQLRLQLVFLIDEFDGLCRSMSAQGFALLRALRDDYKYRLMYVVATRLELKRLRAEANEIEAFEELIASHTFWIGPYTEAEAQLALRRLETRHQAPLDHQIAAEVLRLSGGHPGLIREVYYLAQQQPANLALVAARHAQVVDECQRIWLSLAPEEQQVMINLNGATPRLITHPHLVEQLRRKGLVNGSPPDAVCVFSPLLADYINRQSPATSTSIYLDYTRHTVWINGYEVTGLTRLEYELLAYLDQRRSQTCSRDELAHHLYPDEAVPGEAGISDTRLDSIIKRLRRKIEPNPHEPRYLVTMHGYGFRLQDKVQPL